ncbi:glycoside hydrolase family 65 protein [Algoriphagus hitonicola]|uniref:Trehalose and maltose hydrolase (Possible phosphorylase) n=1 Tax=Algoriphagus hitonicola TaxID=435880 RepID=A0A1I2SYC3_9BACT|nr:glycosyl hydrolase family 65 protein [Algoriphagus hitonicola]SFG57722.1 Trehalose and maltose hydrolase (possible phosphorylase) [Algoriphagus hitonicola]
MSNFNIEYKGWKPEEQKLREAICTLGNGYIATRGAAEENKNDKFNYPGTYLAGGFNRAKTKVSDKTIENEDFVNFPNWLCLSFRPEDGEWLDLEKFKVLHYNQTLEMKVGVLTREFRVQDKKGRRTAIKSHRIVSMRDHHMVGLTWIFQPENWSGKVIFNSGLDGNVTNNNVERYKELENRHLEPLETEVINEHSIFLRVQTRQSKITVAQAARTKLYHEDRELNPLSNSNQSEGQVCQEFQINVKAGEEYTLEKIVAIYTSRDEAISEAGLEAKKDIRRVERFKQLLFRHTDAYIRLWHRGDLEFEDEGNNQDLLRLHIFHIMQTVSKNSIGRDVGVPARGLHGEAYRGHVFWDELYIFPFLNLRFPDITRSLLMYRYERLDEARHAAKEDGKKGAMFPWQSGSNGREESQEIHLNPNSGNWIPDNTHLQRHINSAIVYNIWNYYLATDDQQFMDFFGAEMILSIALFWESMVIHNETRDRFEIHHVVGPDEYHTNYPDSDEIGLNNNAYTNVMAAYVMQKAIKILDIIEKSRKKELLDELGLTDKNLALWREIGQKMYIPFLEGEIIEQFEGYGDLEEFAWDEYREKYEDIQRLDRVLESEDDTPNKYKASKQADVLMLFYLFSKNEIQSIFEKLGYEFTEQTIGKNIEYYRKRTTHGSTLSRVVFSWILIRYDKKRSWENFKTVLVSDFKDIQGGTTPEGIHLGAMAGSVDLVQRGFLGLEVCEDALWVNPPRLKSLKKIKLKIKYRRHWISILISDQKVKISFEEGHGNKVNIGVFDKILEFELGQEKEFSLPPDA